MHFRSEASLDHREVVGAAPLARPIDELSKPADYTSRWLTVVSRQHRFSRRCRKLRKWFTGQASSGKIVTSEPLLILPRDYLLFLCVYVYTKGPRCSTRIIIAVRNTTPVKRLETTWVSESDAVRGLVVIPFDVSCAWHLSARHRRSFPT